ncbi:TPA: flagellar motor protein MotA [Candidatus Marinimicrobia bacterium]|nr:MAG: MotA/TolQ/ExbB proton channel [Marinimicrobia bacterium 46_47]KUK91636.1 MAG: Biopolymer transport protein [Marinimicrobia bacterium 46_43]HAE87794.1 flagellar motor protein MotA [Candidatus Neomarinimicrobiota bacterium]HBY18609.1 flagellar motor protein MotA [Candidatus Neomarinimicrobiota bacterium]
MVELFVKGGPFMPWILGVFIFGLIIVFERFYSLTAAELRTRSFLKKIETILREEGPETAKEECEKSSSPVAAIYHEALSRLDQGLERVEKVIDSAGALEMAFLEKNQIWLTTVVTIAPMLGFIGTVSGMVGAFNDVAAANDISPAIVASGISEALLTTLFGLIVAVIISIFQNWFMSRIDKMVIDLEKSAVTLVDVLSEKMKK